MGSSVPGSGQQDRRLRRHLVDRDLRKEGRRPLVGFEQRRRKSIPLCHPPKPSTVFDVGHSSAPYLTGRRMVDDHISLKSWNGRVYAAVKDASRGINIDGPILILLVRGTSGGWESLRHRLERRRPHASRSSHRPGRERAPRVRKRAELQARHDLREDVAAGRAVVRRSGAGDGRHLRRSRPGARGGDVDEATGEPSLGFVVVAANFMNHTYYYLEE